MSENMCPKCMKPGSHAGAKFCNQCSGNLLKTFAAKAHGPNPELVKAEPKPQYRPPQPQVTQERAYGMTVSPSEVLKARNEDGLAKYRVDPNQTTSEERSSIEIRPPAVFQTNIVQSTQQRYMASANLSEVPVVSSNDRYNATVNPSDVFKARTEDGLGRYRIDPNAQQDDRASLDFRPAVLHAQGPPPPNQPQYKNSVNPSEVLKARTEDGLSKYRIDPNQAQQPQTQQTYQPLQSNLSPQPQYQPPKGGLAVSPSEVFKARTGDDGLSKYRIDPTSAPSSNSDRPNVFQGAHQSHGQAQEGSDELWHLQLSNLPSDRGLPVQVFVNGRSVFSSEGFNGVVTSLVSTECVGDERTEFLLKLPAVNFELRREITSLNGRYIKFDATPGGMKFVQQAKPF